jgi:hypothetical protein
MKKISLALMCLVSQWASAQDVPIETDTAHAYVLTLDEVASLANDVGDINILASQLVYYGHVGNMPFTVGKGWATVNDAARKRTYVIGKIAVDPTAALAYSAGEIPSYFFIRCARRVPTWR